MKAIIVDDSRTIRTLLGRIMTELGYASSQAEDGADALRVLRELEGRVDLALVDWNMPVMNGLELVRAMKGDPSLAHIPIVMVTTETDMERVAEALEAGAVEYIMKPFTKEVLEEKLALVSSVGI